MRCVKTDQLKQIPWEKIDFYDLDKHLSKYQMQKQRMLGMVCIGNIIDQFSA